MPPEQAIGMRDDGSMTPFSRPTIAVASFHVEPGG
jgi:hypothetical protein